MSASGLAYLHDLWMSMPRHGYVNVDHDGRVLSQGGQLAHFGLGEVSGGAAIEDALPVLFGMLPPADRQPLVVESVNLSDTQAADLHLVPLEDEICITLVDVSTAVQERQVLQQQAHDAVLRSEELARTVRELDRAKAALEQSSRAKTALLTNVSHELRTPLTAIIGFSGVLMGLTESLSADQIRYLERIERAGKHLNALVSDLLDLSRVELGRAELNMEEISLRQTAAEAAEMVAPQAEQAAITLRVELPEKDPLMAQADRTRVKQVVSNLVSNAIKYNRPNGSVTLRTERLDDTQSMRLVIADTGPGLTAEQAERVFNPFERLGRARKDIEGTGVGLSICQSLMTAMGGGIGVDSEPGEGSAFWIEFSAPLQS